MPTLRQLRERVMLTQEELAQACGVSRYTIWEWEHARARPSIANQRKLVKALEVNSTDLLQAIKETRKESEDNRAAA